MLTGFCYQDTENKHNANFCKGYLMGELDAMRRLTAYLEDAFGNMSDLFDAYGEEDTKE